MVRYIPTDIWSMILQQERLDCSEYVPFKQVTTPPIAGKLSLINTEIRGLALPFLFHTLEFGAFSNKAFPLAGLIRQFTRARSLLGDESNHLLKYVQRFSLSGWSAENAATLHLSDLGELSEEIFGLIAKLAVFTLMPHLQDVYVECTPVTSRLHAGIFSASRPPLRSVTLWSWYRDDVRKISLKPAALSILKLKYSMKDSPATRAHFADIISSAMPTLRHLQIPAYLATVLVACIHSNPVVGLALDVLSIKISHHEQTSATWTLFEMLPKLCSLRIYGANFLGPYERSARILPNLESIDVGATMVPLLTDGKKLQKVFLRDSFDGGVYSATDKIRSIPQHLREVNLAIHFKSYQQFLSFLRSLRHFPNLDCLRLGIFGLAPPAEHEKRLTREEICDTLVKELRYWPTLRIFIIFGWLWRKEDGSAYDPWYDVADINNTPCPIAPEGDPLSRGHDSLEVLSWEILKVLRWGWISGKGWMRGAAGG